MFKCRHLEASRPSLINNELFLLTKTTPYHSKNRKPQNQSIAYLINWKKKIADELHSIDTYFVGLNWKSKLFYMHVLWTSLLFFYLAHSPLCTIKNSVNIVNYSKGAKTLISTGFPVNVP